MRLEEMMIRGTMNNREYTDYMLRMSIVQAEARRRLIKQQIDTEENKLKKLEEIQNPDIVLKQQLSFAKTRVDSLRRKYQAEVLNIANLKGRLTSINR